MKCVGNVLASANERSQLCHTTQIESSQKFGFFFFCLFLTPTQMLFVQQPFSMTATIHGILVCVTFELFRSAEDIIYGNLLPVSEIQINIQRNHRPTPCTSTDSFRTLFLALVNCEPRHTNNVRPNICRFVRVR